MVRHLGTPLSITERFECEIELIPGTCSRRNRRTWPGPRRKQEGRKPLKS